MCDNLWPQYSIFSISNGHLIISNDHVSVMIRLFVNAPWGLRACGVLPTWAGVTILRVKHIYICTKEKYFTLSYDWDTLYLESEELSAANAPIFIFIKCLKMLTFYINVNKVVNISCGNSLMLCSVDSEQTEQTTACLHNAPKSRVPMWRGDDLKTMEKVY